MSETLTVSPAPRADEAVRPALAPIEQVRDLLFGDQQRGTEQRLRGAERQIQELTAALRRMGERFERSHTDLQASARDKQLQLQLRMEEMQRDYQERLLEQQRGNDQRLEQLQGAVTEMLDALDRDKVDQQQLSGWLVDLAARMQRTSPARASQHTSYDNGHAQG